MKPHKILLFALICTISAISWSQDEKYTLSGTLKDASSGEDIIGARIGVVELPGTGTITNVYGFYSLTLPKGDYHIYYKSVGFDVDTFAIKLDKDVVNNLELNPAGRTLKKVDVTAEKLDQNVKSAEMGVDKLSMTDIENIPVLFGEKDPLKTIQLLPGVKSAGEGNSGFYVRGGGADQNLVLLDGAPVYNASHLLGFFSVFNSDALKDIKLYKGAAPAEFGGRLSSVLDIHMKEGNLKKFSMSGGIGLISSKLTLEAPIVKDKGSFIVSGRRTYADLFLAFSDNPAAENSILYFYDLNAKANYRLGEKDRLFVSGYFGRDKFGFADQFGFDWGNSTATLRWNHIYGDKLFGNMSFVFSNYNYKIKFGADDETFEVGSEIQDFNLKKDFDWFINNNNTLSFGANVIHHTFRPGEIETGDGIGFEVFDVQETYSIESAAYASNEHKIGKRITLVYGLRGSNFTQVGPGDIITFDKQGNVTDISNYGKWEQVRTYWGLAPRFTSSFLLDEKSSIKLGYSRTYQYLHLISNSTASSPTDIWLPSSVNIKPQISDQGSIGYFRNFLDNQLEFSTEMYYKYMQNVIDYRDGAEVTLNPAVEGELLFGIGRAYGVEFLLKKRRGKFTGWVSYTLSRTEKKFTEINSNNWFPARQDRTHDISIVGMYNINDQFTVSATWVYYTGNAVTFPSGKYEIDGHVVNYYSERNGYRMPDYHRADIGMTFYHKKYKEIEDPETGEIKQVPKKWLSSWNFSIYNLYARENAFSITFEENAETGQTEAVQLALFKIVPSISYNFKF
ncbi:TonB-dependent receptor [Paracrocinitomix mangrovi]|uniref:TonB-dependent receptor n=1 Tax=Paracrocinitomix mangrovi TaxID=2862509 RepID=UPI001C8E3146|nr:TonB-dependent receptor plug domain-containing protein [Paracrocinitomix mangrovi]UKN03359.1 TonB-dependent receptor [Paracrocinitomix mangrovi]